MYTFSASWLCIYCLHTEGAWRGLNLDVDGFQPTVSWFHDTRLHTGGASRGFVARALRHGFGSAHILSEPEKDFIGF